MSSPLLLQIPKSVSLNPSYLSRTSDSLHRGFSKRRPWQELFDFSVFFPPSVCLPCDTSGPQEPLLLPYQLHRPFQCHARLLPPLSPSFPNLSPPPPLCLALSLLLQTTRAAAHPLRLRSYAIKQRDPGCLGDGHRYSGALTNIGSLLMSAALVERVIICIHGAFGDPEDLFLDCRDQLSPAGFFPLANRDSVASASAAVQNAISIV